MKVEYINPFIEAAQSIVNTLCSVDAKPGKVYLKASPFSFGEIVIIIGVVGEFKGQVCFEMNRETAKKIASAMMGGMLITELDEMSKSAISEMGNMIMGNASTIFSRKAIGIDITPPTLLAGSEIQVSNRSTTIVIPMELDGYGIININIIAGGVV